MSCNKRILVVDDDITVHNLYRQLLGLNEPDLGDEMLSDLMNLVDEEIEEEGEDNCDVTLVDQGNKAIEAVRTALEQGKPFQLVFLDMRLPPGIDGKETAEEIRKMQPELPIVFVSAYSDYSEQTLEEALSSAPVYFNYKPFARHELELAIEKWAL